MANEEQVIFTLDVDESSLVAALAAAQKAQRALREEQKSLNSELKAGKITEDEYSEAIARNTLEQQRASKSITDAKNSLKLLDRETKNAKGSLEEQRAILIRYQREFDKLPESTRTATKEGQAFQKRIKELSEAILEQEQATGRSQRNVGNYASAIALAGDVSIPTAKRIKALKEAAILAGEGTPEFEKLTKAAAELKDKVDDANEAISQDKGTQFEKLQSQLGGVGESLANADFPQANERIKNFGNTLKGVSFKSLSESAKGFGGTMVNLGKVILANPILGLLAVVVGVGAALFALKDKVKFIGDAFQAVTDVVTGFTDAIGLTTVAIDKAAAKEAEATKASLRNFTQQREAALAASKVKIGALDREISVAQSLGKETVDLEIAKQKEILNTIAIQIKATENALNASIKIKEALGTLGDEIDLTEQQQELADLVSTYKDIETEIVTITNTSNKKQIDDKKEALKQLEELRNANTLAAIEDVRERSRKELEIQNEANLESVELLKVSEKLKQEIRDAYNEQYKLALEDLNEEILAKDTDRINKTIKAEVEGQKRRQSELKGLENERLQQQFDIEQTLLEAKILGTDQRQELDKLNYELLLSRQAEELALFTGTEEAKTRKLAEQTAQREALLKEQREAEILANVEVAEQYASAFESVANIIDSLAQGRVNQIEVDTKKQIDAINKLPIAEEEKERRITDIQAKSAKEKEKIEKENAKKQKAFAIIQALINGALGATKTIAQLGFPAAIPFLIAEAATVAASIAAITAQKFEAGGVVDKFKSGGVIEKFANGGNLAFEGGHIPVSGGMITGRSHATGGVKFRMGGGIGEAQAGEAYIVNVAGDPVLKQLASDLNVMGGGKAFFKHGGFTKFQDGGNIRAASLPVFESFNSDIVSALQGATFVVGVDEIIDQTSKVVNVKNRASS